MKLLSVVVPTYNQENGIDEFYRRIKDVMVKISPEFDHELIFINDYSMDNTLLSLKRLAEIDQRVKIISFSKNFGNQIAIAAGLDSSKGDIVVVIDDDLQDPPELIISFIKKWKGGFDVVYGYRPKRKGVGLLFLGMSKLFYALLDKMSDTEIPRDAGDFRLMDKKVVDVLKSLKETNRYYRGIVSWVGFKQYPFFYERDIRYAGKSNFTFKKYFNFAINGFTSFTDKPLFFSSIFGIIITIFSFLSMAILIVMKLFDPSVTIRGWTSIAIFILFFGGIQLLSIGILGIYMSKIYLEVKGRPLYIIDQKINF